MSPEKLTPSLRLLPQHFDMQLASAINRLTPWRSTLLLLALGCLAVLNAGLMSWSVLALDRFGWVEAVLLGHGVAWAGLALWGWRTRQTRPIAWCVVLIMTGYCALLGLLTGDLSLLLWGLGMALTGGLLAGYRLALTSTALTALAALLSVWLPTTLLPAVAAAALEALLVISAGLLVLAGLVVGSRLLLTLMLQRNVAVPPWAEQATAVGLRPPLRLIKGRKPNRRPVPPPSASVDPDTHVQLRPMVVGEHVYDIAYAFQPLAHARRLTFDVWNNAPDAWAAIDYKTLHGILAQLISDAIKSTIKGQVTVAVDADADHVYVRVRDTGVGFDPYARTYVFSSQGTKARTEARLRRKQSLSRVRMLAALMHGRLVIENSGEGSTFMIALPRIEAPVVEAAIPLSQAA